MLYVYNILFIHLLVDGHVALFYFLATVSSAGTNIDVQYAGRLT